MLLSRSILCGIIVTVLPVLSDLATAQDFTADPTDIYAGCDTDARIEASAGSPRDRIEAAQAPTVDRITERAFASFSLTDIEAGVPGEMASLCWKRLDGVWREVGQVTLDRSNSNSGIWGSATPDLLVLANGNYTTPLHIVIVETGDPEQAIWLTTGLSGAPFVKFVSNDAVSLDDVLQRGGPRKVYQATGAFEYGRQVIIDVPRSGRVRLSLGRHTFVRPQPGVSKTAAAGQIPANDAFLLSYNLENLSANRRGYDPIAQHPFYLLENPKLEVFAQVDPSNYYITEKRTVPLGFSLVQENSQGMIYRKSLMTSESEIQETNSHSFGAKVGAADTTMNPFATKVGFDYSESTSRTMIETETVTNAIGFSRAKQYALVVDHPYATLSDDFIDAVEDARRYHRYQALIDRFGTHYPYAVTYGSAAKITHALDEQGYTERVQQNEEFSAMGSSHIMGVGGEVQVGFKSGSVSGTSGTIGSEGATFVAVGGNGSWDQNGYGMGSTPYPILLDLRPIDELLNPMNFPGEPQVYETVRQNLRRAILAHLRRATPRELNQFANLPEVAPPKPKKAEPVEMWSVYIRRAACTKWVGDFRNEISGTIYIAGKPGAAGGKGAEAGEKNFTIPCHIKRRNTTWSYGNNDPGLLTIYGTRAQIADFTARLEVRVDRHDRTHKRNYRKPEPMLRGLNVGKSKDFGWKLEKAAQPSIHLVVRFKRRR